MGQHYEEDNARRLSSVTQARAEAVGYVPDTPDEPDEPLKKDNPVLVGVSRRDMVIASEYKRMLSEAAQVDEMAENIYKLVERLAAKYSSILESVDLLGELNSGEIEAAQIAYRIGLIPLDPTGGKLPSECVEALNRLRDVLPENS